MIYDCEFIRLTLVIKGHGACVLSGGWMGAWGRSEIFELGEVNAHGVCASATNKQLFN